MLVRGHGRSAARSTSGGSRTRRNGSTGPINPRNTMNQPSPNQHPRPISAPSSLRVGSQRGSVQHAPNSRASQNAGPPSVRATGPPSRASSPELGEPISESVQTGQRRQRDQDSTPAGSSISGRDTTQLTPRRTKRLKVQATQLSTELGVPKQDLFQFIESGNVFLMLLQVYARMVQQSMPSGDTERNKVKEILRSKDFETTIRRRLTACLLSPHLTAYKKDTTMHILTFIQDHRDIFKVPELMIEDIELNQEFGSMVSKQLSSIRGQLKTKLIRSIENRTSVMDIVSQFAGGLMDINSSHWVQVAFLRTCLRCFLIGTCDFKDIPLEQIFSRNLSHVLHPDLDHIIEDELNIYPGDIRAQAQYNGTELEFGAFDGQAEDGGEFDDFDNNAENEDMDVREPHMADKDFPGGGMDADGEGIPNIDYDGIQSNMEPMNNGSQAADKFTDEEDTEWSGFGTANPKWALSMFWDYVDHCLEQVRDSARKESTDAASYQKAFDKTLQTYLQRDLIDFPGRKKINKLLKDGTLDNIFGGTTGVHWQDTINEKLVW